MHNLELFNNIKPSPKSRVVNVASVPQRSPFRYPGGKTWLVPIIRKWLGLQKQPDITLVDCFAGGGIVSLTAAFENLARRIIMIELDEDVAAAGYNAGEGRIMRAMKKHRTEDFWVLASQRRPLKRETREYVPKYLAAMMIAKAPDAYGFDADEGLEPEPLEYDKVVIKRATDLRVIAEAAETTVEEIKALNPELLRWFTPPDAPDYGLRLPKGSAERFYANIGNIPLTERLKFHSHTVRRGDTLSMLAKRYGTSVQPIQYLNNIKGARLRPGTTIMIPVRTNERAGKGKDIADVASVRPGKQG